MRLGVREDRAVGRAQGRKAERVRGRPGRDREGAHGGGEEAAEGRIQASGPFVIAISACKSVIGVGERGQNLRAGAGGIVAEEAHQSIRQRNDQAPKARKASVVAARYSRCGATWASPAPSSMTARAASRMWVSGKTCATHCTQRGESSSENHTPDSSIMGQVSTLSTPANQLLAGKARRDREPEG